MNLKNKNKKRRRRAKRNKKRRKKKSKMTPLSTDSKLDALRKRNDLKDIFNQQFVHLILPIDLIIS
jgi:hypothetical protein